MVKSRTIALRCDFSLFNPDIYVLNKLINECHMHEKWFLFKLLSYLINFFQRAGRCFAYETLDINLFKTPNPDKKLISSNYAKLLKSYQKQHKNKETLILAKDILSDPKKTVFCLINENFNHEEYQKWHESGGYERFMHNSKQKEQSKALASFSVPQSFLLKVFYIQTENFFR